MVKPLLDPGLSCSALVAQAMNKGLLLDDPRQAQSGDLLVLKGGPSGWKHVGIVLEASRNGQVNTVEGNTSQGVSMKTRLIMGETIICLF